MPGIRTTAQLSGGAVAVQLDETLAAIGVTDWLLLTGRVAVQCTGVATAVTLVAERSTADPAVAANPAPVGAPVSGNPSAGMQVLAFDEGGAAWWRVRLTALTGAAVAIGIGGRGVATPAGIAPVRTAQVRLARLRLAASSAIAGTLFSAEITGRTAGSELRLSRNPGGRWSLSGTTLSGRGLRFGIETPSVIEHPGNSGAMGPRETDFDIRVAHDPAIPAFVRPGTAGTPAPTPTPGQSPTLTRATLPVAWVHDRYTRDAGLTPVDGPFASWAPTRAVAGVLAQANAAQQPVRGANGGIKTDGASSSGDYLSGPNPGFQDGLVLVSAIRGAADGAAAAPSGRTVLSFGRASDSLALKITTVRKGTDAGQTQIRVQAPGNGSAVVPLTGGWAVGQRSCIAMAVRGDQCAGAVNGQTLSAFTAVADLGTVTATAMQLAGDVAQVADRAEMEVFEILLVPGARIQELGYVSANAGNPRNQWHVFTLEGMLAHEGLADLALLPATHPFKTTAPKVSDLSVSGVHQGWANSLGVGAFPAVRSLWSPKGVVMVDSSVGSTTTTQIMQRLLDGFNTGSGTHDNTTSGDATKVVQRKRPQVIGPFFANGPTDNSGSDADRTARMFADLATMVATIEAAQGVGAGEAAITILAPELTDQMTAPGGVAGAARTLRDARKAQLASTYPRYAFDPYVQMLADAAPAGASPDADAFANGRIPAAYWQDGLHLTTAGYARMGFLIAQEQARRGYGPAVA